MLVLLHLFLEGVQGRCVLGLLFEHVLGVKVEDGVVMGHLTAEDAEVLDQAALHHLHDIHQLQLLRYHCFCHYRILYDFFCEWGEILKQEAALILLQ